MCCLLKPQDIPCRCDKGQAVVFSPKIRAKISTGKYAPLDFTPASEFSQFTLLLLGLISQIDSHYTHFSVF